MSQAAVYECLLSEEMGRRDSQLVTIQSPEIGAFSEDVIASAAKQSQRVEEEIATSLRSSQ